MSTLCFNYDEVRLILYLNFKCGKAYKKVLSYRKKIRGGSSVLASWIVFHQRTTADNWTQLIFFGRLIQ